MPPRGYDGDRPIIWSEEDQQWKPDLEGPMRQSTMPKPKVVEGVEFTVPDPAPTTDFYAAIDPEVRDLVHYLRSHGINTTCSCEHEAYIQFDVTQDTQEVTLIHRLLANAGYCDYRIETQLTSPRDGFPMHRGEVLFNATDRKP